MRRNYCEDSVDTRICTLILLEGLEGLRKTNWLWWCRLHFFSPFDHCCSCCIGFEKKAKYSKYIGPIEKSEKECILLPLYFDSSSGTRKRIVHGIQYCVYSFVYAGILSALINNNTASFFGCNLDYLYCFVFKHCKYNTNTYYTKYFKSSLLIFAFLAFLVIFHR